MVSALDSEASGRVQTLAGNWLVEFKTLYSHGAFLHPEGGGGGGGEGREVTLRWTSIPSKGE